MATKRRLGKRVNRVEKSQGCDFIYPFGQPVVEDSKVSEYKKEQVNSMSNNTRQLMREVTEKVDDMRHPRSIENYNSEVFNLGIRLGRLAQAVHALDMLEGLGYYSNPDSDI